MWLTRVSTRLAVVQWASSDGGSPRLATRSTPPFFWACAFQPVPATPNVNATIATVNRSEALCVMRHLLEVLWGVLREMMPQRPLRHQLLSPPTRVWRSCGTSRSPRRSPVPRVGVKGPATDLGASVGAHSPRAEVAKTKVMGTDRFHFRSVQELPTR